MNQSSIAVNPNSNHNLDLSTQKHVICRIWNGYPKVIPYTKFNIL